MQNPEMLVRGITAAGPLVYDVIEPLWISAISGIFFVQNQKTQFWIFKNSVKLHTFKSEGLLSENWLNFGKISFKNVKT